MEFNLSLQLLTVLATVALAVGQQQQQLQPVAPQPSAPLLGVRYSAATDVSHISFNSPLVTYGSSLNEIQLPAAPVQPANLKQLPQSEEAAPSQPSEDQTLLRSFGTQGQTQQLQAAATPSNQPQFISVQQFPANPQLQVQPQNLPGNQQQSASRYAAAQQQPVQNYAPHQFPTVQSQQQQYPQFAQQQSGLGYESRQLPAIQSQQQFPLPQAYVSSSAQPVQQYFSPQGQYVLPQQQQQQLANALPQQYLGQPQQQQQLVSSAPTSNGYFATGPYAAQYQQPNLLARQQYPQTVAAAPQFVSRVAFNGPTTGFSYSF
ncbi:hypothetical protein HUJ04_007594 [Dendroctonus ponderosae]|uniref:DUF4794 domain-containing protein n=1 Tax=Dendroctonus ponderosae TaxID=77166 RepID=A0AAR5QB60_DENPD|nr:hypothetical protein HUJ04_007594 [Dendroctonus ponderosae]